MLRAAFCLFALAFATPALADPGAVYSPFAVESAHLSISFKDVGLRLHPDARAAVLEAVAAGVASSLAADQVHRPDWTQAAWHRQCRREHVYVDMWRSVEPDRLGFSLWTGCSIDDRIAHVEMPTIRGAFEATDGMDRAGNFGEAIGDAIRSCTARPGC